MRHLPALFLLTVILGFTVLEYGGVTLPEWNLTLTALCATGLFVWMPGRKNAFAPPLARVPLALAAALVCWVALQLLPLPAAWLKTLSPDRFDILEGLRPIHAASRAALSIAPEFTFAQLLRLCAYLLVFFLLREIAFRLGRRVWLAAIPLIAIALAESVIGLVQHFASGLPATGTYANHGHLAGLIEMTLPLTLVLIPIALGKGRREEGDSALAAIIVCVLLACAAVLLLGLVYTVSRMGLAAAVISVATLGILELSGGKRARSRAMVVTVAGGLIMLAVSAPLILVSRYESGLTSEVRLQIWHDTLRLIPNYAIFGSGLGTFVSAVQKYRAATPLELVDFAHNDYLQLLSELGILGFLIVLAIAFVMVREMLRIVRAESGSTRLIAIACLASIAGIAVHSLVDFQFYIPANVMTAVWITGIAAGIGARRRSPRALLN